LPLKSFLRKALIPWNQHQSFGGLNIDAILVIGGAFVWCICAIYAQVTGGSLIPEVSEVGKACIYVGIGRASKAGKETK